MEMRKTTKRVWHSLGNAKACMNLSVKEELDILEKWRDAYSDQDLVESKIKELKERINADEK